MEDLKGGLLMEKAGGKSINLINGYENTFILKFWWKVGLKPKG